MNGSRYLAVFFYVLTAATVSPGDVSIPPERAVPLSAAAVPVCQIMDKEIGNLYEASMTVIPESKFEDYGESGVVELRGGWEFAYYRNVCLADLDLRLDFGADLMLRSAGVQLPDQLVTLAVDAGMTWRYVNGVSAQVRLKPGVYSDIREISGKALFLPFSGSLTYAFNPALAGQVGLEVRPGFERVVYPVAFMVWAPSDACRLKAGFPESRLTWYASDIWQYYLGADWRSDSFALHESGEFDREMITFEDYRLYGGASYGVSDELRVFGELGFVGQRDIAFGEEANGVERDLDVESAVMLRVGIAGPF